MSEVQILSPRPSSNGTKRISPYYRVIRTQKTPSNLGFFAFLGYAAACRLCFDVSPCAVFSFLSPPTFSTRNEASSFCASPFVYKGFAAFPSRPASVFGVGCTAHSGEACVFLNTLLDKIRRGIHLFRVITWVAMNATETTARRMTGELGLAGSRRTPLVSRR